MSVADAAASLGISEQRVRQLIEAGQLAAARVGREYVIDSAALVPLRRAHRRPGRPMSAENAWGLLAILSGGDAHWLGTSARWRIMRLLESPREVERVLASAEPRSVVDAWRVPPSDIEKILREDRLVPTGLAAGDRKLGVRYLPERDGLDAYASEEVVRELARRLRPERKSRQPNLTLRVPVDPWILEGHDTAPSAVVAADLLLHEDDRVARSASGLLRMVLDDYRHP